MVDLHTCCPATSPDWEPLNVDWWLQQCIVGDFMLQRCILGDFMLQQCIVGDSAVQRCILGDSAVQRCTLWGCRDWNVRNVNTLD